MCNFNDDYDAAKVMQVIVDAGALVLKMQRQAALDVKVKSPGEIVSAADHAAQAFLVERLAPIFPDATFVMEEVSDDETQISINKARDAAWTWVIDPIDGTSNYVAGDPDYGIQVALARQGRLVGGWIYAPLQKKSAYADIFTPMTVVGITPLPVTVATNMEDINIVLAAGDFDPGHKEMTERLARQAKSTRGTRSCAIDYLDLIGGQRDILIYRRTLPWDHAAGAFLANCMSGHVCRHTGAAYEPFDGGETIFVCRQASLISLAQRFAAHG